MSEAVKEAIKEFFRTGILAGLSSAIGVIVLGVNVEQGLFTPNWTVAGLVFVLAVLTALSRAIDKFVHESDTRFNGIVPF